MSTRPATPRLTLRHDDKNTECIGLARYAAYPWYKGVGIVYAALRDKYLLCERLH